MEFREDHPQNFVKKQAVEMGTVAGSHSPSLRVEWLCQELKRVMPQLAVGWGGTLLFLEEFRTH